MEGEFEGLTLGMLVGGREGAEEGSLVGAWEKGSKGGGREEKRGGERRRGGERMRDE